MTPHSSGQLRLAFVAFLIAGLVGCATQPRTTPGIGSSPSSAATVPPTPSPTPTPLPSLEAAEEASLACELGALTHRALELINEMEENGFTLGYMSASDWDSWKSRLDDARVRIARHIPVDEQQSRAWTGVWMTGDEIAQDLRDLIAHWNSALTIDFPNPPLTAMVVANESLRGQLEERQPGCSVLSRSVPTFGIERAATRAQQTAPDLRHMATAMYDALDAGEPAQIDAAAASIQEWAAGELAWLEGAGADCYAREYRDAVQSAADSASRLAAPESIPEDLRERLMDLAATGLHMAALSVEGLGGGGLLDPCSQE